MYLFKNIKLKAQTNCRKVLMIFLVYDLNMYNLQTLIIPYQKNYVNFPPVKSIVLQTKFSVYNFCILFMFIFAQKYFCMLGKQNHLMKIAKLLLSIN